MDTSTVYHDYMEALRAGDRRRSLALAQAALAGGIDIRDLYMEVFQPAMHEVGRLWESNQFTVAQEHLATAITQSVMAQVYAGAEQRRYLDRTLVATTIGGDLHELGIRMIADFFELEGYEVFYLGANMPTADVVRMASERKADLLAISVTLASHVREARQLIEAVRAAPIGKQMKIMVGGQPFNRSPELYRSIGADFTANDARGAVRSAEEALR